MRDFAALYDSGLDRWSVIAKDPEDPGWHVYIADAGANAEEAARALQAQSQADYRSL